MLLGNQRNHVMDGFIRVNEVDLKKKQMGSQGILPVPFMIKYDKCHSNWSIRVLNITSTTRVNLISAPSENPISVATSGTHSNRTLKLEANDSVI